MMCLAQQTNAGNRSPSGERQVLVWYPKLVPVDYLVYDIQHVQAGFETLPV